MLTKLKRSAPSVLLGLALFLAPVTPAAGAVAELAAAIPNLESYTGVGVCAGLEENPRKYDKCVRAVAINLNDWKVCEESLDEGRRYSCTRDVAWLNEDIEICRNIPESERERSHCMERIAVHLADPSLCEEITNSGSCYNDMAIVHGMPELCEKVGAGGNANGQSMCYWNYAIENDDWTYCSRIRINRLAKRCFAETSIEMSFSHPVGGMLIVELTLLLAAAAVYAVSFRRLPRIYRLSFGAGIAFATLAAADFLLWPEPAFIAAAIAGPFYPSYVILGAMTHLFLPVSVIYGMLLPIVFGAGMVVARMWSLEKKYWAKMVFFAVYFLFCCINLLYVWFAATYNP